MGCHLDDYQVHMEDLMGYKDLMAYCTRKWTSNILLRNYDFVCNDFC
jgi:hypothetical protein